MPWIGYVVCVSVYVLSEKKIISIGVIYLSTMVLFLRISTVAVRYATSPPVLQERIRKEDIRDEIWNEYVLIGWTLATPKMLEEQIRISMGQNQVENLLFTFKSLKKLNETQKRMFRDFKYFDRNENGAEFVQLINE